jgi:hypothetical protein
MKIPLRLRDWQKIKKTGRGYTHRELTVVRLLEEVSRKQRITSFLNVGFHDYQDIRNRWWIDICRANSIDWQILEVFKPNVDNFLKYAPAADSHRITHGNLEDISNVLSRKYDVFFHWHGPEHLARQSFLNCLPDIFDCTEKLVILGCPNGHEDQDEAYGNPHEKHVSFWTPEDLQDLGFKTVVVTEKKPGHITAYKLL